MKNTLLRLAACVALLTPAVTGSAAAAGQTPVAHFATAMTELYSASGPYTGALDLRVSADGIVNGYYFPADYSSSFVPVVGGKTGNSIWLDIGSAAITHVDGRIENGVIVGTAFTGNNTQYTFVAKPTAQSAR